MKKTEILSPAGSYESLVAAVRSGADAVYLGMKEMSARRNAENFDAEELKTATEYCRVRGVAVYLTLNIMLKDRELSDALEIVQTAAQAGVSGIIVQDIGLARMIHNAFPELPLHASTQMSVNSPSALSWLKKMGFCRVVAAREMSREELKALCAEAEQLDMEIEVFVHGALCMSASGQCLMSAMLGGRSGNRGLCAGPCRLPFEVSGGSGYDLSLKDNSLLNYLGELRDMGVCSFKIEGRMKRPEYVAAATAAAVKALKGEGDSELSKTLRDVFSRSGFTDGYYTARLGREMFGIRTKDDVVAAGDAIPRLHELYRAERQSVPIKMSVRAVISEPLELTLCDGRNTVCVKGACPQQATNRPTGFDALKESFSKLGATPYFAENFEARMDDNIFLRVSDINELRRRGVEELDLKRKQFESYRFIPVSYKISDMEHSEKPRLVARFSSAENIPSYLNGVSAVVLPAFEDFPDEMIGRIPLIAELPRRIKDEKRLEKRVTELYKRGINVALCGNIAALKIAMDAGMRVVGDIGLNICNSHSIDVLYNMGLSAVTLSAETDLRDARRIASPLPKGIFAYGRLPLMLLENCPLKNGRKCSECDKKGFITDRKGVNFPIRCQQGVSELLNSVPIWLADRTDEMSGLDYLYLRFDDEDAQEAEKALHGYKNALAPDCEYTRGLYFREVL